MQPPVPWFEELLNRIPMMYVGTSSRLLRIVRFLCGTMDLAFKSQRLATPPWRKQAPMLAKWVLQDVSLIPEYVSVPFIPLFAVSSSLPVIAVAM